MGPIPSTSKEALHDIRSQPSGARLPPPVGSGFTELSHPDPPSEHRSADRIGDQPSRRAGPAPEGGHGPNSPSGRCNEWWHMPISYRALWSAVFAEVQDGTGTRPAESIVECNPAHPLHQRLPEGFGVGRAVGHKGCLGRGNPSNKARVTQMSPLQVAFSSKAPAYFTGSVLLL